LDNLPFFFICIDLSPLFYVKSKRMNMKIIEG
jgi:hypothetical protein